MSAFLKKEIEEEGFVFSEISKDVLLIEDFLSKDELSEVLQIIDSTPEESWWVEYHKNLKTFCMTKFGRDDVENLVKEGKFEITQNWQDKNFNISNEKIYKVIYNKLNDLILKSKQDLVLSGFATIQRMQEGVELKSHTDQTTDPSIRYASILYLNDDYVDGELFFKNIDIELKPKKGSLILFPGNQEHEHGVRHVGPGPIRYVLVGFIKVPGFYENNKY
jgi:hypothetical protein